jgi:hypothetical protein
VYATLLSIVSHIKSVRGAFGWTQGTPTEAKHDVEEYYEYNSYAIDGKACRAHPEWARGDVLSSSEKMRCDCQSIGSRGEDNERASKIREGSFAPERNGS